MAASENGSRRAALVLAASPPAMRWPTLVVGPPALAGEPLAVFSWNVTQAPRRSTHQSRVTLPLLPPLGRRLPRVRTHATRNKERFVSESGLDFSWPRSRRGFDRRRTDSWRRPSLSGVRDGSDQQNSHNLLGDLFDGLVETGAVVVVEDGHGQLRDQPGGVLGVVRAGGDPLSTASRISSTSRSVNGCVAWETSAGYSVWSRKCSDGDETGTVPRDASSPRTVARRCRSADVSTGSVRARGLLPERRAVLVDDVLDNRQQEVVLAREVAIEGLERDAGFFDEILGREARALGLDEAAGRRHDGLCLLDTPVRRPLHDRRPLGGTLGPGHTRHSSRTAPSPSRTATAIHRRRHQNGSAL